MRARVAVVLGATVAIAAIVHAALALRSLAPWIVPDELIYSEIAKSLGDGGLPEVRGDVTFEWGLGYSALIAPIWAVVDDVAQAYAVAKIWNALILASTVIPAFFLARRFTSEGYALVVAALTVSIPPLLYAGTLMTEVALYPAFVLAVWAMTRAVGAPSARTQLVALGAIGLACIVKSLSSVLIVALVAAIVLYHALDRDRAGEPFRSRLRPYLVTWVGIAATAVVAGAALLIAGSRPQDALGTYANVLKHMQPSEVPRWIVLHLAELDLALAVIPLAAAAIVSVRGVRGDGTQQERLYVSIVVPVVTLWLVAVGTFASVPFLESFGYPENVDRLQGRSTFMLAPLFFTGLVMWLRDRRGSLAVVAGVAAGAALLPALIPLDDFDRNVRFQALALVPWVESRDEIAWPAGVLFATLVLGFVFVAAARIRAPDWVVILPIVTVFLVVAASAHVSMNFAAESSRNLSTGPDATWIDQAASGDVSVLWAEPPGTPFVDLASRQRVLFVGEFFNRRMGDVYEIGSLLPYNLPSERVRLRSSRVVHGDGRPVDVGSLVLVPCHVRVVGETVASNVAVGATIVRVEPPLRATVADPLTCAK
jgi:hypothetical protein